MMRSRATAAAAFLLAALLPILARADGCMMPSEAAWKQMRERSMINEPEQKAVVFFSRGREDLIISPSYEGPADRFAWVMPVPSRPRVEILKGAIFHELAELVMPPESRVTGRKVLSTGAAPGVTVLERKTVGAYDVSVLSATDSGALLKWLRANKYHLPPKAAGPVKDYVKERWTFVACRVKAPGLAKGLRTGTLAPIRLTFAAKQPVYPLRLSSANPAPFSTLVYLILPTSEVSRNVSTVSFASAPGRLAHRGTLRYATLKRGQSRFPTLSKLSHEEMQVFVEREYWQPRDCTRDYVWDVPIRRASH